MSGTHFIFRFRVSYRDSYSKMCCSGEHISFSDFVLVIKTLNLKCAVLVWGWGGRVTDLTDVKEHEH